MFICVNFAGLFSEVWYFLVFIIIFSFTDFFSCSETFLLSSFYHCISYYINYYIVLLLIII